MPNLLWPSMDVGRISQLTKANVDLAALHCIHSKSKEVPFYPMLRNGVLETFEHLERLIDFAIMKLLIEPTVQSRGETNYDAMAKGPRIHSLARDVGQELA